MAEPEIGGRSRHRVLILDEGGSCQLERGYLSKPLAGRKEPSIIWIGEESDLTHDSAQALRLLSERHYDELVITSNSTFNDVLWQKIRRLRCVNRMPLTVI